MAGAGLFRLVVAALLVLASLAAMELALDLASTEFYRDGQYVLAGEGASFGSAEWADWLTALCDRFPIVSLEDADALTGAIPHARMVVANAQTFRPLR